MCRYKQAKGNQANKIYERRKINKGSSILPGFKKYSTNKLHFENAIILHCKLLSKKQMNCFSKYCS